jgi:hypothetical protein
MYTHNPVRHREKVAIAHRIRTLLAKHDFGCCIRHYSDGRDIMLNGIQGSMFCAWCPEAERIPLLCPETCAGDRKFTCHSLGICPCSILCTRKRLRAFMRWLLHHQRESLADQLVAARRAVWMTGLDS